MATAPLVNTVELSAWLGLPIAEADPRAVAVLALVSARIRSETGVSWLTETGELAVVPEEIRGVALSVAGRMFTNPRGVISQTAGPFGVTYSPGAAGFDLTAGELAILARYRKKLRGLYVVNTYRGDIAGAETIYVPTSPEPAGYPFPWYAADDPMVSGP